MDITIVTPTKLQSSEDFDIVDRAIRTLYKSLGSNRPLHYFSTLDTPPLHVKLLKLLNHLAINYKEVSKDLNYLESFLSLTDSVTTKYYYFQSSDVTTLTQKNILETCIEAMDKDPLLCHVRIGGYPLASGPNNYTSFTVKDGIIVMNDTTREPMDPIYTSTGDVVWTIPMEARCQESVYAWPVWCSVVRTDILKRTISSVKGLLKPTEKSMSDILGKMCGARDLIGYTLPKIGWPEPMRWISEYRQGFLNLANYTCPLGRVASELDMLDNHMHEIRSVGDLEALRGKPK
jgi:hypothetical protein